MLSIRSKSETGFRRAGLYFPHAGVCIDPATLTKAQRAAIDVEPQLVVTEIADADADAAPAKSVKAAKADGKSKQAD